MDIGCGVGRHAIYLQEKGFDVIGIDNSPLAVEVSKLRGLKNIKLIPIEKIPLKIGTFENILMLGNNFGLFGNYNKARRLLKKFHRITSNNALIIAETDDPYNTTNPDHIDYHKNNR